MQEKESVEEKVIKKWMKEIARVYEVGVRETGALRETLSMKNVLSGEAQAIAEYAIKNGVGGARFREMFNALEIDGDIINEVYEKVYRDWYIRMTGQQYFRIVNNPNSHSYTIKTVVYRANRNPGGQTTSAVDCHG